VAPFAWTLILSPDGKPPAGRVALAVRSAPEVRWRIVVATVAGPARSIRVITPAPGASATP